MNDRPDTIKEDVCLLQEIEELSVEPEAVSADFRRYLGHHLGRFLGCDMVYLYQAIAFVVRDRLMADWRNTWLHYNVPGKRRAHYLSLEYLIGRSLANHTLNADLDEPTRKALNGYAVDLEDIESEASRHAIWHKSASPPQGRRICNLATRSHDRGDSRADSRGCG